MAYLGNGSGAESLPARLDLIEGTFGLLTLAARRPNSGLGGAPGMLSAGGGAVGPALSPDGRFLYYDSGGLARYRIDGDRVSFDELTKERVGGGAKTGICVAPDGKFVCLPTGGGNDGTGGYGTWIYRADDFAKPAYAVRQGAYPGVVGFDPSGKRVYAQNSDTPLLVFDAGGVNRGAHKFGRTQGSAVREFAGHPRRRQEPAGAHRRPGDRGAVRQGGGVGAMILGLQIGMIAAGLLALARGRLTLVGGLGAEGWPAPSYRSTESGLGQLCIVAWAWLHHR